jgi:isoleucyl-tRNA synthetase
MSIGPTVLSQTAETLRKLRNTARFLLGNLRDHQPIEVERAPREQLSMVSGTATPHMRTSDGP